MDSNQLEVKYGLPRDVVFCKKCVISNQRPTTTLEYRNRPDSKKETIGFDAEGVCSACRVAERKAATDWTEREKELWDICDRFRRNDGSYDCLVPGSGGKDSVMVSHLLKFKYRMHPLTVTWTPHLYTDWGWKNFQSWIHAGFDNYLISPNGRTHRLLTRLALENLFHPFQPFMFGQKMSAPRLALKFDIPLIFYGEPDAEYGSRNLEKNPGVQSNSFFTAEPGEFWIGGVSSEELKEEYGLTDNDLTLYRPLDPEEIARLKVESYFFGYYHKWHQQAAYYYAVKHSGFQACPERNPGTYSKYTSIDDKIDDLHFYTTYIKFGIGRASYDASQEIRSGDITREEGVALVHRFEGEYPKRFEKDNFEYLSIPADECPIASKKFAQPIMTREYFETLADKFRSPHLWEKIGGKWKLRYQVS